MVVGVEQMRKVPLFEFGEPEGFRELGQLHLKEGHGVDETNTGRQTLELEDFTSVTDLTQFETELMQRVDDGITVNYERGRSAVVYPLDTSPPIGAETLGRTRHRTTNGRRRRRRADRPEDWARVGCRLVWLQCQRTRERAVARCRRRRPMSAPE